MEYLLCKIGLVRFCQLNTNVISSNAYLHMITSILQSMITSRQSSIDQLIENTQNITAL